MTLSGTDIVAITGPGAFLLMADDVVITQNIVTGVSGTAVPGRIDLRVSSRIVGTASGVPFTMTGTSRATFINNSVAPAILTQPQGQTIAAGSQARFTVVASGSPPLQYQWRKEGSAIAGATSATLTLSNVTTDSAGSYSVVVSNSVGNVASNDARLTVTPTALIAVNSTPVKGGTVAGGGLLTVGTTTALIARPSLQYVFREWQDGNKSNPRTVPVPHGDGRHPDRSLRGAAAPRRAAHLDGAGRWILPPVCARETEADPAANTRFPRCPGFGRAPTHRAEVYRAPG